MLLSSAATCGRAGAGASVGGGGGPHLLPHHEHLLHHGSQGAAVNMLLLLLPLMCAVAMVVGQRLPAVKALRMGLGVGVGHHAIAGGPQGTAAPGSEEAGAAGHPAPQAPPRARCPAGGLRRGGSQRQGRGGVAWRAGAGPGRQQERPGCRRRRREPACGLNHRVARKGWGAWL